ncbi:orotate phosphoribosyltransferase [uncultured Bifidobacterium sp.]|uniref:orotate phosphoribosyltransferase n=1 Tax=uncultured Bifidobacterium sp. TaxID=165187 RepID=UPI00260CFAD9|nr:orotate phosphoribosyltransferase [uncultured Bifidobacterium sp.]
MSMKDISGMGTKSESIHTRFTRFLINAGALKFGDFRLKSGRRSPYFINAGAFDTGNLVSRLGGFYAERVLSAIGSGELPGGIDTIFGPAYKGIPLAISTAMALTANLPGVGYTFDRKERKDHGDGGIFVGMPLHDGMRILLVDDVMTAGTAMREVVPKLRGAADVEIVGLVLSVDRMERVDDSGVSAVRSVEREFGFPVLPIVTIREVFDAASSLLDGEGNPVLDERLAGEAHDYLARYGASQG